MSILLISKDMFLKKNKKASDYLETKNPTFLICLIVKNRLISTIEKRMLSNIESQYGLEILFLYLQGVKNFLLEKDRLFRVKARNISNNEIVSLFPCYSESIITHINLFGGYQ